jgi:hypothetical protein
MRLTRIALSSLVMITVAALAGTASAQSSYRLQSSVMGSAGARSASTNYKARSTMAQPTPIGTGSSSDKILYAGFWAKPWVITGILETDAPPFRNALFQNYPNPFRASTSVAYSVRHQTRVGITVYNVRGQKVRTLVNASVPAGKYLATWDCRSDRGREVSPGVYFYSMRTDSYSSVKKMVVFR